MLHHEIIGFIDAGESMDVKWQCQLDFAMAFSFSKVLHKTLVLKLK